MLSDCLGRPFCVCCDYSYSCTACLIDKGVRATFVLYCHDLKLCSWQPLQGRSHVARPNAPPGSVFKLDDMTSVVFCYQHASAASVSTTYRPRRDIGLARASTPHGPFQEHCLKAPWCTACTEHRMCGWPGTTPMCQNGGRVEASSSLRVSGIY